MTLQKFALLVCCAEWHDEQLLSLDQLPNRYCWGSRIFWSSTTKFSIMLFLVKIFKNSYLSVCAHSRISFGTKVVQLEELYKISWETPTLIHITLVNTVRVYRVTSDNLFPPKLISKNFLYIFILFFYSRSTK